MTVNSHNTGAALLLIDQALAALGRAMDATSSAAQLAGRAKEALRTGLETPLEGPSKSHVNRDEIHAAHRRSHRRGSLGKVASDPELEAFVRTRMQTMTLQETVAAVAATFAPDRHISVSSLNRWWLRTGKALLAPDN